MLAPALLVDFVKIMGICGQLTARISFQDAAPPCKYAVIWIQKHLCPDVRWCKCPHLELEDSFLWGEKQWLGLGIGSGKLIST